MSDDFERTVYCLPCANQEFSKCQTVHEFRGGGRRERGNRGDTCTTMVPVVLLQLENV